LVPGSNPGGPTNEFKKLAILTHGSKTGLEGILNLDENGFTAGKISAILSRT
jgi:hypothetical protein